MTHGAGTGTGIKDVVIDLIAGSLGGVALVYVGQPLDTVKVKLQTFPNLYRGMFDCIKQTALKEGIRGLYAGTVPAIAANVAENSVLFAAYGGCQKFMKFVTNAEVQVPTRIEDLSLFSNATAGFLAAFFSSFTLCPTELIKCQLQAAREVQLQSGQKNTGNRITPYKLTKEIIKKQGITGLFRGLDSTIAREMPGYFVFFGGYELTRQLMAPEGKSKEDTGALGTMVAGAVGGMAFWLFVFPADVVKSRIQVSNLRGNLFSLIFSIGRQEGIRALYSGLGPTLIRTVPATATLFVTVEYTKKILHSVMERGILPSGDL